MLRDVHETHAITCSIAATVAAMPGPWRSYTEAERAEAVGVALTIGTKKAAVQLGIPRRTLSSWLQRPTAEVQVAIVRSREDVIDRLWEAVTTGIDAVLEGLRNPKARLGEKATALRVVVESYAAVKQAMPPGETPTANEEPYVSIEERHALWQFVTAIEGSSDEEIAAWAAAGGAKALRDGRLQAEANIAAKEAEAGDVG